MEKRIEKQTFFISEFNEEATWLSFMHRQGWKFLSTSGKKYEFEQCEPEDWIYQLDFKENGVAEEDYIQMFTDYGWEYTFCYGKWFYFRKMRTATDEDLSIFSDKESKIELCKRVINADVLRIAPILLLILVSNYLLFFTSLIEESDFLKGARFGIMLGSILIYVFSISMTIGQYKKLYKMIKNYENPVK
jgi:hypothetical protein